jgi:LytS/YehU family sensor histidine kinase
VKLDARVTGEVLRVEVWNTGTVAPNATGTGIGVRNVRERLAQLFPGRHRFELTDERGWVRALVELPAQAGQSSAA